MIKHVFGRKLKRDVHERNALFKSLLTELVMHERIQSTEEKIKAIKADADKLVTKAKYEDRLHAYTLLQPLVSSQAVNKLINEIGPRFSHRQGGYTRVIKMDRRFNDNARMAMIEWTEKTNGESRIENGKLEKGTNRKIATKEATAQTSLKSPKKSTSTKAKTSKVVEKKPATKKVTKKEAAK
ncbi:MAG: 50S ribosomal protein L17 [Rhabdochlamydiaceae bacterium]